MLDYDKRDEKITQKIEQIQNAPPELWELLLHTRYARLSSVILNPRPMTEEEKRGLRAICPQCNDKGYRILYTTTRLSEDFDTSLGKGHWAERCPCLQFCVCLKGAGVEELHKQGEIWIDVDIQNKEGLFTRLMKKSKKCSEG